MQSYPTREHDPPRDRVTGVPAESPHPKRTVKNLSSAEIEQEIRRTRARMGATLDEIEGRLSPSRIKHDVQHTVRRTIDDVRQEYSPRRMAQRAQTTMLDTIKDNPVPALAAGLSIGYLIMKGAEGDGRRAESRYGSDVYGPGRGYYEPSARYASEAPVRIRARGEYVTRDDFRREYEEEHGVRERFQEGAGEARERIDNARERAGEMSAEAAERGRELRQEAEHRARHAAETAERRGREVARQAGRRARAAEHSVEDFVYENPLAAGAIAVGIGALLGGLFPSTKVEDEYLGPARDEAVDRTKRVAEETMRAGRESADKVMDEAKESARDVAETAKTEAKRTAETAKDRAASEADEAKSRDSHRTPRSGDTTGSY